MTNYEPPAWFVTPDEEVREPWLTVTIWIPRFALVMTRSGVRRRLLLPGTYEMRRSNRLGRRLYR